MGQNSSTMGNNGGVASPRNKSKPPRPLEPPKLPKIPNYVVPENKVIPNGIGDMENARKLLRPVSQELTKVHPDFADIFQYDPEIDFLSGAGGDDSSLERSLNGQLEDKENSSTGLSNSNVNNEVNFTPDPYAKTNGSVMNGMPNGLNNSTGNLFDNRVKESNLKRTHSLERDRSNQPRVMGHKRQASLTNGILPPQQPVIPEDPREHLYNVTRHQPFSNLMPANASLPLKSSFQSDYSLNLTYAQLAEYRRQQRNTGLEDKTGQKLKDLGVEISATNTTPKSPFDLANLGAKSKPSTHSVSTGSSEAGVSKSKKKKAAPPPPPPPPLKEPPADYDMQDDAKNTSSLQRRNSSASGNLRAPAPDPDQSKRMSIPTISRVERNQIAAQAGDAYSSQVAPPPPPPPPPPPLPPPVFAKPAQRNSNSSVKPAKENNNKIPGQSPLNKSMSDARAQLEMLKQMASVLKAPKQETSHKVKETENKMGVETNSHQNNVSENITSVENQKQPPDSNNNPKIKEDIDTGGDPNNQNESTFKEAYIIPVAGTDVSGEENKDSPRSNVKRMNSLLQHDIILAAKAQGVKQKKLKQPHTFEKPKDAAQVFREELQKAAQAREERRKGFQQNAQQPTDADNEDNNDLDTTSDENLFSKSERQRQRLPSSIPDGDDSVQSIVMNNVNNEKSLSNVIPDLTPIGQNGVVSTRSSASFENMSISSNNSQRVYSSTWTPEEDLEPDDDILQERNMNRKHSAESQGFKSSIVPMKVKDLKDGKGKKIKKNVFEKQHSKKETEDVTPNPQVNKNKFGSIRRFRKSVHDNVKNAFGSISKASGKLLKKNKSQDFLSMVPDKSLRPVSSSFGPDLDASDNWELLGHGETSMRRSKSAEFLQRADTNDDDDFSDEDSDEHSQSDAGLDDIDFASGIDNDPKTKKTSKGMSGASPIRQMKRAGVAYVSGTGQIIVLPEYNTVNVDADGNEVGKAKDDEGRAPKLFRKKNKKLNYESTVRVQEKTRRDEIITREIREKENQIERERLRQQEIERDFRRLRDLDTQERLQRMQTDNILQQLTLLQQQQVRQAHMDLNNGGSMNSSHPSTISNVPLLNGGSSFPSHLPNHPNSLTTVSNLPQHQNYTHFNGPSVSNQSGHHINAPSNIHNNYFNPQPSPHIPKMSPAVNTSHYTTHSEPIIGNVTSASAPSSTNNMPNLSVQDLNYLSGYMRMMGVAPPANQQQWAFLLSSVSFNSPNFPDSRGNNTSTHNTTNGPDLSQLFGVGKTFENTVIDSNKPTFYELVHKNKSSNNIHTNVILSQIPSSIQENTSKLVEVDPVSSDDTRAVLLNGTHTSTNDNVPFPNSNSSPEERLDSLTSSGNFHNTSKDSSSSSSSKTVQFQDGAQDKMPDPVSPRLPAKVYGPLGFKPVPFKAGAT